MIIVSAADENFAPHFATMLHSAWTHNPDAEFHLIDCGIEHETRVRLKAYAERIGARLAVIPFEVERFAGLPTTSMWSVAVYGRLCIPDLLPHEMKVLHLDADCVVVADLRPLWDIDLAGCLLAGVDESDALREERKIGLSSWPYINAGVMLMNLQAWREENAGSAALELIRTLRPRLLDQSAINAIANGRIKVLPAQWNFMLHKLTTPMDRMVQPCIIHCTGPNKPWLYGDAPFASIYRYHRNTTPFPLARPKRRYRSIARRLLNLAVGRPKYGERSCWDCATGSSRRATSTSLGEHTTSSRIHLPLPERTRQVTQKGR